MNKRFAGLYVVAWVVPFCLQIGCQQSNQPAPPSSPPAQTGVTDQASQHQAQPSASYDGPIPLINLPESDVSAEIFSKSQDWKVVVGGKRSPHGIFEHPSSDGSASVTFPLEGRYQRFTGAVAINDTVQSNNGSTNPLTFVVQGDGQELWRSQPAQKCGETQPLSVDVSDIKRLTLIVESKGSSEWAHAVWFEPMLEPKAGVVPHSTRRTLWEIGDPNGECRFDTNPADDPEVVDYQIGDPEDKFPEGLGTDIGQQRSKIRIRFTGPIPMGARLHVSWSPGGSEAVDQFKVELDGKPLGESPALQGTEPAKLRTDSFAVPPSNSKDHVLVFSHPQGDGLGLRQIRVEAE